MKAIVTIKALVEKSETQTFAELEQSIREHGLGSEDQVQILYVDAEPETFTLK